MPIIRDTIPSDGSVTTAKIANGAVTNTAVASNAAIAVSKLAALPRQVIVPFLTVPSASSSVTYLQQSGGFYGGIIYTGTDSGAYLEWEVWLEAGTYTLLTSYRVDSGYGIAKISIDGGSALATTIDMYAAVNANNNVTNITGIAFTAGLHTIRYYSNTKNASSAAYRLALHGFSLTRTGA